MVLATFAIILILVALVYSFAFGPIQKEAPIEQFLVTPEQSVMDVAEALKEQGFVRSAWTFDLAYLREADGRSIRPGGYEIRKSMDAWTIAAALVQRPSVAWVTVPVGMRREEIGDLLEEELGWTAEVKAEWLALETDPDSNYIEGVYFPDTYLIPTDEPPAVIAERMQSRFKEAFAPYADEALKKKVPWPTVLTIASIIQREAGSVDDMYLISGVIQRRLAVGMPLAMDATFQYMTGSTENGWWPRPKAAATYPDDPFNTYTRKGLPPHPIASPGLAAIEAALNPVTTKCLFYIHDAKGNMHCSPTYAGHLANINRYLK